MNLFESRFHRQTLRLIAAALITSATFLTNKPLSAQDDIQPMQYPKTKTVDQVDEYFGLKVADPYRWLEDDVRESDVSLSYNIGSIQYHEEFCFRTNTNEVDRY